MINYDSEFVPIDVPYIDITNMNNTQQFYHLNQEQQISDNQRGFIGVIEKEYDWILVSLNDGKTQVISLSGLNIAEDYKISIGRNLTKVVGSYYYLHMIVSICIFLRRHLMSLSITLIKLY